MSEAKSRSNTPQRVADGRQDMAALFTSGGRRGLEVIRELISGGLISYQGNQ